LTDIPEIDVGKSTGDVTDSNESDGSRGGGGRRSKIVVKMRYGTKVIPPTEECHICGDRAVGVLVPEQSKLGFEDMERVEALCSKHRDQMREHEEPKFVNGEFRRFIDA